jgi:hypothetical protein
MLSDAHRCKVMMVTTPAMTPVSETAEAADDIVESVHVNLTPIVVNKCEALVPAIDITHLSADMREAYQYARDKLSAQEDALAVLNDSLELPQLHLSRHRLNGAELIEAISGELSTAIAGLS